MDQGSTLEKRLAAAIDDEEEIDDETTDDEARDVAEKKKEDILDKMDLKGGVDKMEDWLSKEVDHDKAMAAQDVAHKTDWDKKEKADETQLKKVKSYKKRRKETARQRAIRLVGLM